MGARVTRARWVCGRYDSAGVEPAESSACAEPRFALSFSWNSPVEPTECWVPTDHLVLTVYKGDDVLLQAREIVGLDARVEHLGEGVGNRFLVVHGSQIRPLPRA